MILNNNDLTHPYDSIKNINTYRVEQEISIKLNSTPVNNTTIKTDYAVMHNDDEPLFYSVRVNDHISKISPDSHQPLLDVVKEIDIIKNNVDFLINARTGKLEILKNHQTIINKWDLFKEEFLKKHEFIRAKEKKQDYLDFVSVFDEQINSCEQLIICLDNQIFFTTLFDYFLVNYEKFESEFTMNYNSQLFNNIVTPLLVSQRIIRETPTTVLLRKIGMPEGIVNTEEIRNQYNEKYRGIIDYQFSEYQVSYDAEIEFNTEMKYLEYADIRMNECVKNNLEMDISCRIRRVK
ncbi:hypothetical protein M976_02672 [Buttiauxella ferragutiae ATCC 51602]|uniref:Uncharacterized protein n=1 Tax=Buttiauxella ferragutiae ATCC 51602 TaxID=1354252 RepID=A0ABX2W6J4_9ENTR|nr:hypothetical protein [Buttiauxella ferragutiae]OAT26515.1 hypothetical protein M976_02672 [Buttiauxella ferragutiae ATCC 51602]